MSRNPHSEFLKYHGFTEVDAPRKEETDMAALKSEMINTASFISLIQLSLCETSQNDLKFNDIVIIFKTIFRKNY